MKEKQLMAKYRFTLSHVNSGQAWASAPGELDPEEMKQDIESLKNAVRGGLGALKFEQLHGGIVIIPDEVLRGCVVSFFEHIEPAPPTGAQTTEG